MMAMERLTTPLFGAAIGAATKGVHPRTTITKWITRSAPTTKTTTRMGGVIILLTKGVWTQKIIARQIFTNVQTAETMITMDILTFRMMPGVRILFLTETSEINAPMALTMTTTDRLIIPSTGVVLMRTIMTNWSRGNAKTVWMTTETDGATLLTSAARTNTTTTNTIPINVTPP